MTAITQGTIGWAVKQLHDGKRVQRQGWNGKGQYLQLQEGDATTSPYVWIRTVEGWRVPWVCSQTDLLAADWQLYG